ncbi:hypothetical protein [Microbacterium sp.]|uniref:hypothetical protein n=1 Tax=Microbacterium sp. TaxID=51671 RepID=UPI00281284A0|nr:hypothetical protein [Microbacterium sp.]
MRRNDTVSVGAALPGYSLRAAAFAAAVVGALLLGAPLGWVVVIAVVCATGALWAQTGGVWLAGAALVIVLLLHDPHPGRTAVALAVVHVLHVLAALAAVIPMRATVALRALAPTCIRFAWVQAIGQVIALAVGLMPQSPAAPIAVLAGAGAALLLAAVAGRMLRAQRTRAFSAARPAQRDLSER